MKSAKSQPDKKIARRIDEEIASWRLVCELLLTSGAVTKTDLSSSRKERNTAGQRLLVQIQDWGHIREIRGATVGQQHVLDLLGGRGRGR